MRLQGDLAIRMETEGKQDPRQTGAGSGFSSREREGRPVFAVRNAATLSDQSNG